ncbi:hypothetical protein [Acinetobacter sp. Marseille-Q1618]|uniref:hypothetical protein n=1 Tax=Acinetobacter sp. Marseille-Q1618 TaxID=2697502 RepID=UPI0020C49E7D|nr:hypothetical protein [Acinetobacter sp. Marseille-Q1618]
MQKIILLSSVAVISFGLLGCQTDLNRPYDLNAYLHDFLGQSSQSIQDNLNFKKLGYQSSAPQVSEDQLIYTVYRPLNIPIPQANLGQGTVRAGASSYDINFQCKIIFELTQGIAKAVNYSGRAC